MPSKKQYDLVTEDCGDSLIPLHSEEAFKVGINFHVKYIGTQEVPRPTSRVEIVAAMRRVRYEFKARLMKKNSVDLTVSTDGVKVCLREKRSKKFGIFAKAPPTVLIFHPIYRIFYVSHDSQDMLIFSFIARDATSNTFKCNVFKASKKAQAMTIVRTIGQAFDVCHRLSMASSQRNEVNEPTVKVMDTSDSSPCPVNHADVDKTGENIEQEAASSKHESEQQGEAIYQTISPHPQDGNTKTDASQTDDSVRLASDVARDRLAYISSPTSASLSTDYDVTTCHLPLTAQHHWQLMRQQVEQQEQQTRSALAEVTLLSSQLVSETAARIEAQNRVQQLLRQNRELLEHINSLVGQLNQLEIKMAAVPAPLYSHHVTTQDHVTTATVPRSSLMQTCASPSRQQLSLALKNTTWSSSANGKSGLESPGGVVDARHNMVIDNGPSSDLGSSGPGSNISYSPGDRLDQFQVTPSPLSETIASPDYKTTSRPAVGAAPVDNSYLLTNGHMSSLPPSITGSSKLSSEDIPRIEPPPKTRKVKSNRPSPSSLTPTSPEGIYDCVKACDVNAFNNNNNNKNGSHYNNGVYTSINNNKNDYANEFGREDAAVNAIVSTSYNKFNGRQIGLNKLNTCHQLGSLNEENVLA